MRFLLAALLAATHAPVPAQVPMTVSEMQRACAVAQGKEDDLTPEGAIAVGACFGLLRGVVQVMQANCRSVPMGSKPAAALSVGEIPTASDAIAAFESWVAENPDESDSPAAYGVITALSGAYPCGG